jgi:hypothetical protein
MASTIKRDQWLTKNGLINEFNAWLETDNTDSTLPHGTYTSAEKKDFKPYFQIMRFMKDHKKQFNRHEFPTYAEINGGGRSRKRRHQSRGKKSRSRR